MKKRILVSITVAALLLSASILAAAREVPVTLYGINGRSVECSFISQSGDKVTLRLEGSVKTVSTKDIALLIFDAEPLDFKADKQNKSLSRPHLVVLKDGTTRGGELKQFVFGQQLNEEFNTATVSRIYYQPHLFFSRAIIVDARNVRFPNLGIPARSSGKKAKRQFIQLRGQGMKTVGSVNRINGAQKRIYMNGGGYYDLTQVKTINFESLRPPARRQEKLPKGFVLLLLKSGKTEIGILANYSQTDGWRLANGKKLPANAVAAVYFTTDE